MSAEQEILFTKDPHEALEGVKSFVQQEIFHRNNMLKKHPERSEYWMTRVSQAEEVLRDLRLIGEHL